MNHLFGKTPTLEPSAKQKGLFSSLLAEILGQFCASCRSV
ncbi:hypothetical protein HMPREF9069_01809 [Atopobium sp. oral taxon 810 str. F0209]|nr:hypothetical protein HMPREF9069_01809 [Atopobium sp. oral taxon 810 str. F0209]